MQEERATVEGLVDLVSEIDNKTMSVGKIRADVMAYATRLATQDQAVSDGGEELRAALQLAVKQNSHDMLMTGEELRQCEQALALTPQPLEELRAAAQTVVDSDEKHGWVSLKEMNHLRQALARSTKAAPANPTDAQLRQWSTEAMSKYWSVPDQSRHVIWRYCEHVRQAA